MARRGYNHPVLRWLARILSLASLGMLLLFVLGDGSLLLKLTPSELVQFVFFPIGVAIGLVLGWRSELFGGIVAISSLAMFYLSHLGVTGKLPGGPWFLIFTLPGILFFCLGLWRETRTA